MAIVGVLAACGPRVADDAAVPARAGLSIALYTGELGRDGFAYGAVDDRRWVDVVDGAFVLDRIDRSTRLSTLVIEPLGPRRFTLGACVREQLVVEPARSERAGRMARKPAVDWRRGMPDPSHWDDGDTTPARVASPLVRCAAAAPNGRYFVRVFHLAWGLQFAAHHEIHVGARTARIATRLTIPTPDWRATADVVVFDGVPGGEDPLRELARGTLTLDGGVTTLAAAPRELPATVRVVFDGAERDPGDDPRDESWGNDSRPQVLAVLDVTGELPGGTATVHVEHAGFRRAIPVDALARDQVAGATRLPLWVDHQLVGQRDRVTLFFDERRASQDVSLRVSNHGDAPRTVIVEERLRPARERSVRALKGRAPALVGDVARLELVVPAGTTEHVDFVLDYRF